MKKKTKIKLFFLWIGFMVGVTITLVLLNYTNHLK
jgi:hypothetical protein